MIVILLNKGISCWGLGVIIKMITVKYLFPFTNKKARFHSKMSAQSSNKTNNYHKEAPKTPKLHKISTKTNNLNQEPTQSK